MSKLDLSKCTKDCHECIFSYIKKHNLKKGDKFKVQCSGIPEEYLSKSLLATSEIDPKIAISMFDPVTWANEFLDWHCIDPDGEIWKRKTEENTLPPKARKYDPELAKQGRSVFHRPYQAVLLRCSALRKVMRIGRQAGKCLVSGTLIQMEDGSLKPIEDIQDGEKIIGLDDNYNLIPAITYKSFNGIKEVAKMELMDGREIEGSLNHPFLVRKNIGRETKGKRRIILQDSWVELGDLKPGDFIAVPRNIGELGTQEIENNYKLHLLGLMLADGNITSGNCRFSNQNHEILDDLRYSCHMLGCSLKQYPSDAKNDYHIIKQSTKKSNLIRNWLRELGIWGLNSHEKYIPDFVFKLKNKHIASFLKRMYGCDGWACVSKSGKPEIGYSTVSEKMAHQIIALLSRFGIYADVRHKTTKLNGENFHSRQIVISRRESIVRFVDNIGLLGKDQAAQIVKEVALSKNPSYKTEVYEDEDIVFIPIRSINITGKKATWDLSVPSIKNFIANNIISHNTESLCITALWLLWTNENFRVVLIAPYQAQIDMIFSRLRTLLNSNELLANSVARSVKAPNYQIELNNGSLVIGFTAGTKSNQGAGSARGQPAHALIFDEADMLSSDDMNAALATIANSPDALVMISSTPTGKRGKFYQTCHNDLYKEYHYPSQVNPNWDEAQDDYFRSELTEAGYEHEILAEFGSQEEGVYKNTYIDRAKADYEYGDYKPEINWTYGVGVDWNDPKNGTQIAVIGYNPYVATYFIVQKYSVNRAEWTQLSACQKIIEVNREWNPDFIYIDRGHGGMQYEMLRDFGFKSIREKGSKHPDSRLLHIVKQYDFGSSLETRDLVNKTIVKKHAKEFLVENSVRQFEQNFIRYPASDKQYAAQLNNYIVDRVTDTGRIIYKADNETIGDHFLDAVNLCLVGFTLEKTAVGKPRFNPSISFADNPFKLDIDHGKSEQDIEQENPSSRTNDINKSQERSQLQKVPSIGSQSKNNLWSWPGFGHDAPRPDINKNRKSSYIGRTLFKNRPTRKPKRTKF